MESRTIDGITYEQSEQNGELCLRRYDTKQKRWIELFFPVATDKKKAEAEIIRLLSDFWLEQAVNGDGA